MQTMHQEDYKPPRMGKQKSRKPVPMRNDAACQATLELTAAPETEK
jgi:hypothetical protein